MVSVSNNDHYCTLLGLFICLKWCSMLLIERYLAAKIGIIFLVSVWRSSSLSVIMRDWSGFITFLVFFFFFNKCFHQIGMIAS